jgi:hypothetical protein
MPLAWRTWILAQKRIGEINLAIAASQIRLVELLDPDEMVFERHRNASTSAAPHLLGGLLLVGI